MRVHHPAKVRLTHWPRVPHGAWGRRGTRTRLTGRRLTHCFSRLANPLRLGLARFRRTRRLLRSGPFLGGASSIGAAPVASCGLLILAQHRLGLLNRSRGRSVLARTEFGDRQGRQIDTGGAPSAFALSRVLGWSVRAGSAEAAQLRPFGSGWERSRQRHAEGVRLSRLTAVDGP